MNKTGRKRLLFVVNSSNYFLSHRSNIASSAKKQGFQIHVASPKDDGSKKLEQEGFIHHDIFMSRSGRKVLGEIKTLINNRQTVGRKSILWNGKNDVGELVPGGIYVYTMTSGNFSSTRKIIFLK